MTANPRGARRTLTITHPDNTTSTRTTTADYAYAVECGPVDSRRWARNLEMRAIEADRHAANVETLLTDGFKTIRRSRGWADRGRHSDFEITVETLDRQTPDIGASVYALCNRDREISDYVRDADGNPVRDADGEFTTVTRPAVDDLREQLERLLTSKREYAVWLREQIAAGPSGDELTYGAVRWSKTYAAASKAAKLAEFAHLRAAGHTLTVVKVDQAHDDHEPGVYISPAQRQADRRVAYLATVNVTALPVPAEQADETPADEGREVTVILDEADPGVERFPVVHVDMSDSNRNSGSVLVTGTGREQSPQAYVSVASAHGVKVWSLDSEYTDNDGSVEPVRLTASTLPYLVNAFLSHLGLDPRTVDHRFDGALAIWGTSVPDDKADVSPSGLAAAVMAWNADRTLTAARWNFNSVESFAARLFGRFAAVVEIDSGSYRVIVRDVLTGDVVRRERATGDDVLTTGDRLLRQARRS